MILFLWKPQGGDYFNLGTLDPPFNHFQFVRCAFVCFFFWGGCGLYIIIFIYKHLSLLYIYINNYIHTIEPELRYKLKTSS